MAESKSRAALVGKSVVGSLLLVAACACQPISSGASSPTGDAGGLPPGGNLLKNATFDGGAALPWNSSFSPPAGGELNVKDGAACLRIDHGGSNVWDAQIRHREMVIEAGHTYNISFRIWADKPTSVRPKVGQAGEPYFEYWKQVVAVTPEPQLVRGGFIHRGENNDPTVEFAFHMGGSLLRDVALPVTVCIDDVYLSDPQFGGATPMAVAELPAIRMNQVGYFPHAKKWASLVSDASEPLEFAVMRQGKKVFEGRSEPLGVDRDSGEPLHLLDFTRLTQEGSDFVLVVGDETSAPFAIGPSIYSQLKYDALKYFYHNRSGIEIKMPFAGGEQWTRPAGHAKSDRAVPCGTDTGCQYSLDVSGGWYDAGDHGKYVVNGGISVWTLLNQFERFQLKGDVSPFGDGKLNLPESGNGVPDLLDEARWEMEFLLRMQVPSGKPHAGMAHHKMHDTQWSALGLAPHEAEERMKRALRPVSTAATLNLAATAAQAARLFQPYDPKFSKSCLKAAETAYAAAKKYPNIYADPADGRAGGGAYDDSDVSDEFYWAAAELLITTRKPEYKRDVLASRYWKEISKNAGGAPSSMNWAKTDALGSISLALVPGALSPAEVKEKRKQIQSSADLYLQLLSEQGYRVPFAPSDGGKYPWGSNSFVINNMIILAYAHDFSGQQKYLEGAIVGMDYLLGRNAMSKSYVTGYGNNPLQNPHHRFWAKQYDPKYPSAPPGALSGGPNSDLQDPYVKAAGISGCHPQKCFVDHIEAWSVNEVTINWNAPLAWMAAFLDENGRRAKAK